MESNNYLEIAHKKMQLEDFLGLCSKLAQHKITSQNIYLKKQRDAVSLYEALHNQNLEEILVDRAEFEIFENFEEGKITVHLKFNGKVKTIKATKNTTIQEILDEAVFNFDISMDHYYLKGKARDFDILDRKELLSTYYDDFVVEFEILEFKKKIHEVQIIKITDEYDKTKRRESIFYKTDDIPEYNDVIKFIENSFGKPESSLAIYKLNAFEEPIKRVKLKNSNLKTFEIENQFKIMVKNTTEMLNFELQLFTVFTPIDYPYDIEKQFDIKIALEDSIADLKEKVLLNLTKNNIYTNNNTSGYYFQVLNLYNVPGKYLLNDSSLIKKTLFKTKKILVRKSDDRTITSHDICVFVRTRNKQKRTYENPVEVLVTDKYRNINNKNYEAFKIYILSKIFDNIEQDETLELVVLDYKNYKWTLLKNNSICIKDGDDLGIVINNDAYDDLQTDELLALKLSNSFSEMPKKYQEKAFKLNPN